MRRGALVPAAIVMALLAGCGADDEPSGSATPTSSPAATSASPSPSAGEPTSTGTATGGTDSDGGSLPVPTATTDVVKEDLPGATQTAVLTEIRVGAHTGYDRVVFELDGPLLGYAVRYVDTLTQDGSGQPVEHEGDAALAVTMMGATLDTSFQVEPGQTPRTYDGPKRIAADLESVEEVVHSGDFEATLSFGIGVDQKAPFRVELLSSPTRLVVDVAN